MRCLVTVGTTEFEELLAAVQALEADLQKLGIRELVYQVGSSLRSLADFKSSSGLKVSAFKFAPALKLETYEWVITHGGAGTVFEGLRAGCKLLVVCNPSLMGNHQGELATTLGDLQYCIPCFKLADLPQCLAQLPAFHPPRLEGPRGAQEVHRLLGL